MKILVDTGCLISLVDPTRLYHQAVLDFILASFEQRDSVYISTLSLAEYGQKGCIADLFTAFPDCISLDFNFIHAQEAGRVRQLTSSIDRNQDNTRKVIAVDSMIISQAIAEAVDVVLTEDKNTFAKTVTHLGQMDAALIPFKVLHPKDISPLEKQGELGI